MTDSITVVEAKAHFAEWMNRVAYQGQRVIIERHGRPVMAWISVEDLARLEALKNAEEIRQQRLAALTLANEAREQMRIERAGVPVPDSTNTLYELREERADESDLH